MSGSADAQTAPPERGKAAAADDRCQATVADGRPCRYTAKVGAPDCRLCAVHHRQRAAREALQECPICLGSVDTAGAASEMACGHAFHAKCIRAWFARRQLTCPVCRATCLEGMGLLGGRRLAPKLQALLRTLPPPPRAFFPTYIVSQLECPRVQSALGVDEATAGLLIDLACESFTEAFFFAKMRALAL